MSEILDAQAAASDLSGTGGGFISLSEALSPQEQLQLSSLQSAESDIGMLMPGGSSSALSSPAAFLDLSVAAQQQLTQSTPAPAAQFDPTADPANPLYGAAPTGSWSATDPVDPNWATDPANPDYYA